MPISVRESRCSRVAATLRHPKHHQRRPRPVARMFRMQRAIHTSASPRILLHEVLAEGQRQET